MDGILASFNYVSQSFVEVLTRRYRYAWYSKRSQAGKPFQGYKVLAFTNVLSLSTQYLHNVSIVGKYKDDD